MVSASQLPSGPARNGTTLSMSSSSRSSGGVCAVAKRGTSLAIVGPNGGGKTTLFRALLNIIPYTGMIRWNKEVRMGYVPQSLVSTDLPISVEEFLRFKCRTDFETCINSVGLDKAILRQSLGSLSGGELQRV